MSAVVVAVAGCSGGGNGLEAVSGTVSLDGQPLSDGVIQFNPQSQATAGPNATSGGSMIRNGRFYIDRDAGLVPGMYWVSINAPGKRGDGTKPAQPGGAGNKGTDVAKELIPVEYNAKTTLKAEIKKGGSNDTLNFELKTKK